ncbi:MAG: hypothetical protein ACK5MK_03275 [Dysgonomonas sp.]
MKYVSISILMVISAFIAQLPAQTQEGEWKTHFSYQADITQIANGTNDVFALSDGKLFSYNKQAGTYETYSSFKGRNIDITNIAFNKELNCLLIIRDNSDINILLPDHTISYIASLESENQSIDKKVNEVSIIGDYAYISYNFGFIIVDMNNKEIKQICRFNTPVYSMTIYNGKYVISTAKGVFSISTGGNFQNLNNWNNLSFSTKYKYSDSYSFSDTEVRSLSVFKDKLHFLIPNKALYILDTETTVDRCLDGGYPLNLISEYNKSLNVTNGNTLWRFTDIMNWQTFWESNLITIAPDNSQDTYWVSVASKNLSQIKLSSALNNFEYQRQNLIPNGPLSNLAFFAAYTGGKIRLVGGAYTYDNYNNPGRLSEFDGTSWYNYDIISGSKDFSNVISDPQDPDHLFVCSWGNGIYEFRNKTFVDLYNSQNSSIQDIFNGTGYTRINGLAFDKDRNLWTATTRTTNIVNVLQPTTNNQPWNTTSINFPSIAKRYGNIQSLAIDTYNNKWIGAGLEGPYLFIFNENGTFNNSADDKYILKTANSFKDEYGNKVALERFYDITNDLTGNLWFSTDVGLYYIKPSADLFDKELIFKAVPVTDKNFGFGKILLQNQNIRSTTIDKANRKWVATERNGVYLFSENMQEQLYHLNTQNSPLPSNLVYSVAIDDAANVAYIGTEKGLVSLKFTLPDGTNKPNSAFIYPYVITANYTGDVTIDGLYPNSYVRITTEKVELIADGFSTENIFTWNIEDKTGKRVPVGNYYVFASNTDGTQGMIGKISVTNR